jgi:Ankyrin repeats (many copies)
MAEDTPRSTFDSAAGTPRDERFFSPRENVLSDRSRSARDSDDGGAWQTPRTERPSPRIFHRQNSMSSDEYFSPRTTVRSQYSDSQYHSARGLYGGQKGRHAPFTSERSYYSAQSGSTSNILSARSDQFESARNSPGRYDYDPARGQMSGQGGVPPTYPVQDRAISYPGRHRPRENQLAEAKSVGRDEYGDRDRGYQENYNNSDNHIATGTNNYAYRNNDSDAKMGSYPSYDDKNFYKQQQQQQHCNDEEGDENNTYSAGAGGLNEQDVQDIFSYARHGRVDDMERLLNRGVPVDVRDEHGNTLLIIACQNGNKRVTKALLRRGANINARNLRGNTPLHFCFHFG